MGKATENRKLVYEILLELEKTEQKADALIRAVLDKYDYLAQRDRAFIRRLSSGCIERRLTLDHVIAQYARTGNGRIKLPVRLILRMGIYQILYMGSVPDAAACNEMVLLAADKGLGRLKGFVNGVLRNVSRQKDKIIWPEEELPRLSVLYSMPEWIVERFLREHGRERTERMLQAYQQERPLSVRLCRGTDRQQLLQQWEEQGISVTESPYTPDVLQLENVPGVEKLAGFADGAFVVQDVSSVLAVAAAGIRPGDTVIDVCAAPGGKSLLAGELCGAQGRVYAFDLTEAKVEKIRENAGRLKMHQLHAEVFDARGWKRDLEGCADVLIADLPCSGLGVLGRKADIRYRLQPEDIPALRDLQREILSAAMHYLKPGGTLVYSTCTVSPEENEENRKWLLSHFPLIPCEIESRLPGILAGESTKEGWIQLRCGFPEEQPLLDGFFISAYRLQTSAQEGREHI